MNTIGEGCELDVEYLRLLRVEVAAGEAISLADAIVVRIAFARSADPRRFDAGVSRAHDELDATLVSAGAACVHQAARELGAGHFFARYEQGLSPKEILNEQGDVRDALFEQSGLPMHACLVFGQGWIEGFAKMGAELFASAVKQALNPFGAQA